MAFKKTLLGIKDFLIALNNRLERLPIMVRE